jgi:hypothetical protein
MTVHTTCLLSLMPAGLAGIAVDMIEEFIQKNQSRRRIVSGCLSRWCIREVSILTKRAGTMLSRTVCTQCRQNHWGGKISDNCLPNNICRWYCPATKIQDSMESVDIENNPPANCQYRFEHAVALAGDDNA